MLREYVPDAVILDESLDVVRLTKTFLSISLERLIQTETIIPSATSYVPLSKETSTARGPTNTILFWC